MNGLGTASTAISATGMIAGYQRVPAVSDVDLEVRPGEMVALLGANGAGKTTTLMALAGEVQLLGGEVQVAGLGGSASVHRKARAGVGVLPERRCVFSALSARDNLVLGRGSVNEALSYFPELEPHMHTRAGLLSGGQQQMLALARIFAGHPTVILADEVSLGLAPQIVSRLLKALRSAADNGAAVLFVEQHPSLALQLADRAYIMRRGRIALDGSASELRARSDEVSDLYL